MLFAAAHGTLCGGKHKCTFCGAPAAQPYSLPDSFTARDLLAVPNSANICSGCLLATSATAGQSPDGKPWMWSWVITGTAAQRHALCTMLGGERVRAGRDALRAACLTPPKPPYAIVLCRAGRTHTLFRSALHHGGTGATVTLDGRVVRYEPAELAARIDLCQSVARTFGSKTARYLLPLNAGRWTVENASLVESWHDLLGEPLTAVAACLFHSEDKIDE